MDLQQLAGEEWTKISIKQDTEEFIEKGNDTLELPRSEKREKSVLGDSFSFYERGMRIDIQSHDEMRVVDSSYDSDFYETKIRSKRDIYKITLPKQLIERSCLEESSFEFSVKYQDSGLYLVLTPVEDGDESSSTRSSYYSDPGSYVIAFPKILVSCLDIGYEAVEWHLENSDGSMFSSRFDDDPVLVGEILKYQIPEMWRDYEVPSYEEFDENPVPVSISEHSFSTQYDTYRLVFPSDLTKYWGLEPGDEIAYFLEVSDNGVYLLVHPDPQVLSSVEVDVSNVREVKESMFTEGDGYRVEHFSANFPIDLYSLLDMDQRDFDFYLRDGLLVSTPLN